MVSALMLVTNVGTSWYIIISLSQVCQKKMESNLFLLCRNGTSFTEAGVKAFTAESTANIFKQTLGRWFAVWRTVFG